jgi:dihydrofolate reductase
MRKLIASEFLSLDGVAQAPGQKDEDTSGGFSHGGWHMPYMDDLAMKWVADGITSAGGFVLGRKTYDIFAAYWPTATQEVRTIADPMNTLPKYVASRTLQEPLAWQNSTLLGPDVQAALRILKDQDGGDLLIIGSTELLKSLTDAGLVDEWRLMIDPLVLGRGKRVFQDDGEFKALRLVEGKVNSKGAIIGTYAA